MQAVRTTAPIGLSSVHSKPCRALCSERHCTSWLLLERTKRQPEPPLPKARQPVNWQSRASSSKPLPPAPKVATWRRRMPVGALPFAASSRTAAPLVCVTWTFSTSSWETAPTASRPTAEPAGASAARSVRSRIDTAVFPPATRPSSSTRRSPEKDEEALRTVSRKPPPEYQDEPLPCTRTPLGTVSGAEIR